MNEIWKDVKDYEGTYQVSNLGRIRSLDRTVFASNGARFYSGKIIKQSIVKGTGYLSFAASIDGKVILLRVHREVMRAFKGDSSLHVNHINGDKLDNRLENLEYVTQLRNTNHYYSDLKDKKYGCFFDKESRKWVASISSKGVTRKLGYFDCKDEAHQAFYNAYLSLHGVKPW